MKLRNKIAAITAAAMLAFTGVGFAAWQFTSTVSKSVTNSNVVTCAVEATGLTADHDTLYLVFDAPTDPTGNLLPGDGIFWSYDADGEHKITELTLTGSFTHQANNLHYEDDSANYQFTVSETNGLSATYIDYTAGHFDGVAAGVAKTGTTSDFADVVVTYTLPVYDYQAAVKAYNHITDLNTMIANLGTAPTLSFTFGIIA